MEELWGISTPRHPKRLNIAPQINGLIIADYLFNKKLPLKEQSLSTTVMRILELKKHQEHKWESGLNIDCPHSLYYLFLRNFTAKLNRKAEAIHLFSSPGTITVSKGPKMDIFRVKIRTKSISEFQVKVNVVFVWEILESFSPASLKSEQNAHGIKLHILLRAVARGMGFRYWRREPWIFFSRPTFLGVWYLEMSLSIYIFCGRTKKISSQGWAGIPVPDHSWEYRPSFPVPGNWE